LANINKWITKSSAGIISSYTGSIPYVWRSIDHKCMAWCKELILVLSRALFDMVDSQTGQLIEQRAERELILKNRFVKDYSMKKLDKNLIFSDINTIEIIDKKSEINFEFNGFIKSQKLIVFDLNQVINATDQDSVFIYSNLNSRNTFYLCKQFNSANNECFEPKDLFKQYGRTIPPEKSGLNIININDLQSLISDNKYTHLVVRLFVQLEANKRHQMFVKFDWYFRKERNRIIDMPNLINREINFKTKPGVNFQRLYLPTLQNVLEGFTLKKIKYSLCDHYLMETMMTSSISTDVKPLTSSNLVMMFYEPISTEQTRANSEQIYYSQLIQFKTKELALKLSTNQRLLQDTVSYVDLIQFDAKHIVHHSLINKDIENKCSMTENDLQIEIHFASILGQFVRFFILFTPAFLAAIIQFYDYKLIKQHTELKETNGSFLMLNKLHLNFFSHLIFSILIGLIVFLLQTNVFNDLIVSMRIYIPLNDFQQLEMEGISNNLLPFFLYWTAYGIVSIATAFLSLVIKLLSLLIRNIILRIFSFLNNRFIQLLLIFLHLAFTIVGGIYSSALANVCIFYGEIIKLAYFNSNNSSIKQTRLLLVYLLLVLNLPSVIVWSKSFASNEIKPMFELKGDNGLLVACLNVTLYFINHFKLLNPLLNIINRFILARLIMFNCLLTIIYSCVNLYRLQYFILVHLFLMSFYSVVVEKQKTE
jgi:hypothetical protein